MKTLSFLMAFSFIFLSLYSYENKPNRNQLQAQEVTSQNEVKPPDNSISEHNSETNILTHSESFLSKKLPMFAQCMVLIGIITLGIFSIIVFFKLAKENKELQEQSFKLLIVIAIIIGSLLILALKQNVGELAPLLGLFGTIAGYLLGKGKEPTEQVTTDKTSKKK